MALLDTLNYEVKECLLSPLQFGIPNHRVRYYMMARRRQDIVNKEHKLHTKWPFSQEELQFDVPELSQFIEIAANDDEQYRVPAKDIVKRHKFRFDIIRPEHTRTSCVTKVNIVQTNKSRYGLIYS